MDRLDTIFEQNYATSDMEVAVNMFDEIEDALQLLPNYAQYYKALNATYQKCLNQKTQVARLNMVGTFAKTDYLLKEYNAPKELVLSVNNTRVRLRKRNELSIEELRENHLADLKNLCLFIALIYKCEVPKSLKFHFPSAEERIKGQHVISDYVRAIVNAWDDVYIYCTADGLSEDEDIKVNYSAASNQYNSDWTYLKKMLYVGAQLNLIRPRQKEGELYPELIIFEPDYLIDISTIARCFTNYAESPYVNLLEKLRPAQNSEAIVLGNFAGQLLDEQIHQLPNTHSYMESITDFWKENAINLLTAGITSSFHSEAQMQKVNIAHAIDETLPNALQHFDSKEGMVEPSFFSEMLGMQGRMDYLQLDFKVLLEQKAGKGDYQKDDKFTTPKFKEEHYVQLLMYMALIRYNYRGLYEQNNRELHAFLLYSKYKESLLGLGFAPDLIFRAIKIRNGLACTELMFTDEKNLRILESLTPEKLNLKKVQNSLWKNFQYIQLAKTLSPIQKASKLEKDYYFRFLTFISNEHVLSKLGNRTKENSGFASTWHDSLDEKLEAGNIYDNLKLLDPNRLTKGHIETLKLGFTEKEDNDMSNFRVGDIVILYSYEKGTEPNACKNMVFRCTIESIESDTITLILKASQSDSRVFIKDIDKLWAIEHDFMESSYSSLYRGMHSFLSAPKERRDLLLLQREAKYTEDKVIKGNYGAFNDLSTKVKNAEDLFLIIGPPGTGKTSFGMLNTLKEELLEPDSSVLLLSFTNRAVDEICSKLYEEGIDFIRIGGEQNCAPEYRDKLLSQRVLQCKKLDELKHLFTSARVIVATTTKMNSTVSLFKLKTFSLAIIDEASQILEPHLIGLLSAHNDGVPAIKKFVMIGDHKQLPAVVQQTPEVSKVENELLNKIHLTDCRLSLFERLLKKYGSNEHITYMLRRQGRMHHDIALFPNYAFYNNQLEVVPLKHQEQILPYANNSNNGIVDLLKTRRIAFINAERPIASAAEKVNQVEADMIAALVRQIYELEKDSFDAYETVGVIVPYRNQIATVRNTLDKFGIKVLRNITIDTVERYQGSQRKYIIYGFTIQKYHQLQFLTNNVFVDSDGNVIDRKLNVAMTRAKEHLVMIGNAELLSNNFTFYKLIEFVRSKHSYFSVKKEDFVCGNFQVPPYEPMDIDLSQSEVETSDEFEEAYKELVMKPLEEASGDKWPQLVLGNDMATNLNSIGYGRVNVGNQLQMFSGKVLSPEHQALLYCLYYMKQNYGSSKVLLHNYNSWIGTQIKNFSSRVHFIDFGSGPGTCGISFCEEFLSVAPEMVYTGIDISVQMNNLSKCFMQRIFAGKVNCQFKQSFVELGDAFWKGCSELPSLIIMNFSYFFSNVNSAFAEKLAQEIREVMKNYPLNRYMFIINHSEQDRGLNAYRVFCHNLKDVTNVIKQTGTYHIFTSVS